MKYLFLISTICFLICETDLCFCQQLPIKATRTISFTTEEGSYMNVDVSPDGRTLLFDLLGDLYSVPVTGGNATQLTSGIALNLRPIWAPDGKRMAYISDISGAFHLNVSDVSGKFHRVLGASDAEVSYAQDPVWMPDGNFIAIGNSVYGLVGGNLSSQKKIKLPLRFAEDKQLVYYLDSGRLYQYNFVTKFRVELLSEVRGYQGVALSPDVRWLTYVVDSNGRRSLIAHDIEKNANRTLISSLSAFDSSYGSFTPIPHYAFSRDSKGIFIGYGGKIHRIDVESGVDKIIRFIAKVSAQLGPYNYNTFPVTHDSLQVKYTRSANASPDGKHLVFSALDRLFVMDIPLGRAHALVDQSVAQFQPAYSPDGKWIAYVSWCDTAGGSLWRVRAVGGQPEQLSHVSGQYQRPAWSPDGKLIAVVKGPPILRDRDDPGQGQLELIPVNGGEIRVIDDTVPMWNQLAFSKDGNRIIYEPKYIKISNTSLSARLVSKDLDAEHLQIESIGTDQAFLQQRLISPDRRFIVYSAGEDLFLLPVFKLADPPVMNEPKQRFSVIKFAEGVDPSWEKGGKVLSWSYGNQFYRVDPGKIIANAESEIQKRVEKGLPDNDVISVTVKPDQIIRMNVEVPKLYGHGMIALRDVRIITMSQDKVIEHGTIMIKDGRFSAVGPTASVIIPTGARVLDLPGTTVMPGLVDLHLHMRIPPDVFPQQSWMYLANLAYGVTTARDPSVSFDSFGYKELLESGKMIGPRLYTVGRPARIPDGMISCDNIEEARSVVHKRAELGGTVIKQYMLPTRLKRQWLLIASRSAGLNMTNEGAFDPILQIAMIKDGSTGVEHNPVWGDVYEDVISFVAASGTYLTPTLQVCYGTEPAKEYFNYMFWQQPDKKMKRFVFSDPLMGPKYLEEESLEEISKAHPKDTIHPGFISLSIIDARIRKQGGHVTLGSHGNDEGIGVHNELWALQMGGLSIMEALQAATIMGAKGLGVQKDIGSIDIGKIADLIVLNRNPLEDIHNSREIRYVMKDGILYDGDTLDTIWPIFKKCPEWRLK